MALLVLLWKGRRRCRIVRLVSVHIDRLREENERFLSRDVPDRNISPLSTANNILLKLCTFCEGPIIGVMPEVRPTEATLRALVGIGNVVQNPDCP